MQYREFLDLCKNKDIVDMVSFMLTPALDLSAKIVVSAIFDQYPSEISDMFGFDYWEGKLSDEPVNPLVNFIAEKVDLVDFAKAVKIATSGFNEDQPGLNEPKIADTIRQYVYANVGALAGPAYQYADDKTNELIFDAFELEDVQNEMMDDIEKELSDILVKEEEAVFQHLLGYQPDELSLEKNLGIGLNLQFNTNPSSKVLKEYAAILKSIGLDAGYFTFPTQNGRKTGVVEISNDEFEVADKLPLLLIAPPSKTGLFAKTNAHLARANELREKSFSDVELANSVFGQESNTAKRMGR